MKKSVQLSFEQQWNALVIYELIELEIAACIVVRDVLHHAAKGLTVVRKQSLLNVVAQQVAEYATEVLMTRIAQERARVSEHAHEATQQAKN